MLMERGLVVRSPANVRTCTRQIVERPVARLLARGEPLLLAVSGGRDSMALLAAVARVGPGARVAVATFDHGTGPAASRAVGVVAETAARLGLELIAGRADGLPRSEAAWRAARW